MMRRAVTACVAIVVIVASSHLSAQRKHLKQVGPNDAIRKIDNKPCSFETTYHQIRNDKTDPRVALMDNWSIVLPDFSGSAAEGSAHVCSLISNQTEENIAVFDAKNKFMHILVALEPYLTNDAITYFAGKDGRPGIMIYASGGSAPFRTVALTYQNGKWQDVTQKYLGAFKLTSDNFLVLPQYGRTARILSQDNEEHFHHKGWITWNGEKFEFSSAKTHPGWQCPETYPDYFAPDREAEICR